MIEIPAELKIAVSATEADCHRTIRSLLTRIRGLYEAIADRFGAEGLELIRTVSESYGKDIAQRVGPRREEWPIAEVGKLLIQIFNNIDSEGRVTEFNASRVTIMINRCPYPLETCELCEAHTTMEHALIRGLNPTLDYVIEKSIPGGDPYCLHVLQSRD